MKTLLSGIQPSGELHIGNYFGALKQFIDLQEKYETFISIVNYHALTTVQNPQKLKENTLNAAIDHLAAGLDPKKATLFVQSDVPEVTELAWIFNTLVTVPYLERGVSYKDKVAQGHEASAGLLTYPVLQAADILIMQADAVPVGKDQKQHIEYARDIAEKFNNVFDTTFTLPEALIPEAVAVVPGIDGQKMSKSYGNTIPLFASRNEIQERVMSIVTDSDSGVPENVFAIHTLFKDGEELKKLYKEHEGKYKKLKEALIEDIDAFIAPLREKREAIIEDTNAVLQILENGAERAQSLARKTMHKVRDNVGLSL